MKHAGKNLIRISALGVLAVVVGMTGCKSSEDWTMAQKWSDHDVAQAVKKELASDPMFKYPDVQPVVSDGNVQLAGFVDTPEQRQRAAELASHAKGARQIINGIELKPTPTGRTQPNTNAPARPSEGAAQQPGQGTGEAPKSNP